jgi:DNA-binding NarL/FixJ family response regulator
MNLSEEARQARNAYAREWSKKNPDKVKESMNRYWERKAANIPIEIKIMNLHSEGLSLREIATRLDISHTTVSRILKTVTNEK